MKLRQLDKVTIDSIHADQIITDLSGALKELFDNAIDASATRIVINLKISPTFELEVTDNGCGIDREDLEMIALRGATSKLSTDSNFMDNITFLGFRVSLKGRRPIRLGKCLRSARNNLQNRRQRIGVSI